MLGADFKHRHLVTQPGLTGQCVKCDDLGHETSEHDAVVEKGFRRSKGPRKVRTLAGMKVFGQPIGTIITRDMVERARLQGKLGGGGEKRYGHYAPPKAGDRGGKMAGDARKLRELEAKRKQIKGALGRAKAKANAAPAKPAPKIAAKTPAPKGKPARVSAGPEFMADVRRASFKDVHEMAAQVKRDHAAGALSDLDRQKRLNFLAQRAEQLRPNKADAAKGIRDGEVPKGKPDMGDTPDFSSKKPLKVSPPPAKKADGWDKPDPKKQEDPAKRKERIAQRDAPKKSTLEDHKAAFQNAKTRDEIDDAAIAADEDGTLTESEMDDLFEVATKRMKEVEKPTKAAAPARTTTAPPKKEEKRTPDQAFMAFRSEVKRFENDIQGASDARAKVALYDLQHRIKAENLPKGMEAHLLDDLDEIMQGPKQKRSVQYDKFADEILQASTKREMNFLIGDMKRDPRLSNDEFDSLVGQIEAHAKDVGVDLDTVDIASDLNPKDWDTHPSKIKADKVALPPARQKLLREGRAELATRADEIRAQERIDHPELTPAGEQLAKGATIEELDSPDGLAEYIVANPQRFSINMIAGGQGGAFSVWDKQEKKPYFFKQTNAGTREGNSGRNVMMFGEAMNEVVSGKVGNRAYAQYFPDADFASHIDSTGNPVIRMDHLIEHAKKVDPNNKGVDANSEDRWVVKDEFSDADMESLGAIRPDAAKVRDPKNPLAIHIFDFLTNQTDRHQGNYGSVKHEDGTITLLALDNGAAFHGFDSYIGADLPDHFVEAPETVGYAEFAHAFTSGEAFYEGTSRGFIIGDEITRAYEQHKRLSTKEIEKDAKDVIKRFSEMSIDEIKADLLRRFPKMDDYERSHLESAAIIFKNRLKNISARDVAKFFAEEYPNRKAVQ